MTELDIAQVWERVEDSYSHIDSFAEMILRRRFSELAEDPMDPYEETYKQAVTYGALSDETVTADIGGSSGEFALNALRKLCLHPELVIVDPLFTPYDCSLKEYLEQRKHLDASKVRFLRAKGENIGMPANSVKSATAINVAFRAENLQAMIQNLQEITEPGGVIGISSKFWDNGIKRHGYEMMTSRLTSFQIQRKLEPFNPPAHNAYFDDLLWLIDKMDGFDIVHTVEQDSQVKITEGEILDDLIAVIKMSARQARLNNDEYMVWKDVVNDVMKPAILASMVTPPDGPKYLYDKVHQGVVVGINNK